MHDPFIKERWSPQQHIADIYRDYATPNLLKATFTIWKGNQTSWINLEALSLVWPLNVVRVRVDTSLQAKFLNQIGKSYIWTTLTINDQGTKLALDGAPTVKNVLPLIILKAFSGY